MSDTLTLHQAVAEKMVPLAKKIVKEWYGEEPEHSPDYCRIGRGGTAFTIHGPTGFK